MKHSAAARSRTMKERELRDLIADVKTGRLSRRAFVQRMIAVGLTAPTARMMLHPYRGGNGRDRDPLQADPGRRRRPAEASVLASGDPAQPAFRRRHQGSGGLP